MRILCCGNRQQTKKICAIISTTSNTVQYHANPFKIFRTIRSIKAIVVVVVVGKFYFSSSSPRSFRKSFGILSNPMLLTHLFDNHSIVYDLPKKFARILCKHFRFLIVVNLFCLKLPFFFFCIDNTLVLMKQ